MHTKSAYLSLTENQTSKEAESEYFNRLLPDGDLRRRLSRHVEPHCAEAQGGGAACTLELQGHQELAKKEYGVLPCQVPHKVALQHASTSFCIP